MCRAGDNRGGCGLCATSILPTTQLQTQHSAPSNSLPSAYAHTYIPLPPLPSLSSSPVPSPIVESPLVLDLLLCAGEHKQGRIQGPLLCLNATTNLVASLDLSARHRAWWWGGCWWGGCWWGGAHQVVCEGVVSQQCTGDSRTVHTHHHSTAARPSNRPHTHPPIRRMPHPACCAVSPTHSSTPHALLLA